MRTCVDKALDQENKAVADKLVFKVGRKNSSRLTSKKPNKPGVSRKEKTAYLSNVTALFIIFVKVANKKWGWGGGGGGGGG